MMRLLKRLIVLATLAALVGALLPGSVSAADA